MLITRAILTEDRPMLILGLSHANLDRLRAGEAIWHQRLEGWPMGLSIFAAATEQVLLDDLIRRAEAARIPLLMRPPGASH